MFTFKQKSFIKSVFVLMILSLVMFIVVGCAKDDKIELSFAKDSYEVKIGETIEVKPTVTKGKDAGEVELVYSSAEEKIATFVGGKVTGVAVGVVRVKVAVKDTEISKEVTIKVVAADSYEIVYHLYTGVNAATNPEVYTSLDLPITLAEPTRVGYNFLGWFTTAEFTGEAVNVLPAGSTGKKEFHAKWELITHNITYHLDGGVNSDNNPEKYSVQNLPVTFDVPTKDGFVFLGWFTDAAFTEKVTRIPAGSDGEFVVYAKFEKAYTITYNLNGGTNPANAVVSFTKSNLEVTLPTPTKEGFDFLGWYEAEDFTGEAITKITEEADIVLYAKWEVAAQTYEITYHLDGGVLPEGAPTSYKDNAKLVLPIPTKAGAKFLGWFDNVDFDGDAITEIPAGSTGAKAFYAKFEELITYQVTYDVDGGRYITTHNQFREEFLRDFYDYVKPSEDLTTFMHGAGKTSGFDGTWHATHKAKLYAAGVKDSDASKAYFINQPVYNAKWLPFFDLLDVLVKETNDTQSFWDSTWTGGVRIGEYFKGTRYGDEPRILELNVIPRDLVTQYDNFSEGFDLPVPAKDGYVFAGWFDNAGFTGEAITRVEKGASGDKEFFAKWDVLTHNVTFDNEGVTTVVEVEHGKAVARPEVDPVKEGYDFIGWFLGEEAFNFETEITGDITLVAKFVYVPMEITEEVDPFLVDVPQLITISTIANNDLGKIVRAHFTLPEGLTLEYQENGEGPWIALVDVFGPASGFPLGDITTQFRATFAVAGTFTIKVEFKVVETGEVLGSKDITVEVDKLLTVQEARDANSDDTVLVRGIVTAIIGKSAYIQDTTAAIYLYSIDETLLDKIVVGNEVTVKGTKAEFNGLIQLASISKVVVENTEQELPEVVVITEVTNEALLPDQGKLVSINGFFIKTLPTLPIGNTNGYNIILVNENGEEIVVRVDSEKNLTEVVRNSINDVVNTLVVNQYVDVVGAPLGWYNGAQIMISEPAQIVAGALVTDEEKATIVKTALENELNNKEFNMNSTLNLASANSQFGAAITWSSDSDKIDLSTGKLAAVTQDEVIIINATIVVGEFTVEVPLTITIKYLSEAVETVVYSTGFDSTEGFKAGTVYNNTDPLLDGPNGQKWSFYFGTPSSTSPIADGQSAQMRWYADKPANLGYMQTEFTVADVTKVVFSAKNTTGINVKVSYSIDGGEFSEGQVFELTTTATEYTYEINAQGNVKLKFEIVLAEKAPTSTSRLYIDNVNIYAMQ